ncbi:MAG: hypothetical protein A3K10_14555 [Bacteroidetes bacterium RIFCSPLOWO2_12_FULL_31_6]|nr:MAG: hypothetical protein A3K10_14555 [Bacteroidetes bacterium RIFCSPLOWO2_12_FULL_31_6]
MEKNSKEENALNSKILKTTMLIKNQYPELTKHLEKMSEIIPDNQNREITIMNLKVYYDSLILILNNYIVEIPK